MLKLFYKKGDKSKVDPEMVKTKFKRYVHLKGKNKGNLNELTSENKVVAAITKTLAMQGVQDNANYYISSEEIWCPKIEMTSGKTDLKKKRTLNSYSAKGRFKVGKLVGDNDLTMGMIDFSIKFRDAEDEMGLPDLVIEEAIMNELPKDTPLRT